MRPEEFLATLLEAHETGEAFQLTTGVRVEPQRGYSGLVATTAYDGWRAKAHRDRPKVGLFDFKVFAGDEPIEHERSVIIPCVLSVERGDVEKVFVGEDPDRALRRPTAEQLRALHVAQAAFMEQEVNWGNEVWQCRSLFSPPSRSTTGGGQIPCRPRDLLMGYIRRCFVFKDAGMREAELRGRLGGFLDGHRRRQASRGPALQPPKRGRHIDPDWEPYFRDPSGEAAPWLWGDMLERFGRAAEGHSDNPRYRGL
jgi:hypothetical protein